MMMTTNSEAPIPHETGPILPPRRRRKATRKELLDSIRHNLVCEYLGAGIVIAGLFLQAFFKSHPPVIGTIGWLLRPPVTDWMVGLGVTAAFWFGRRVNAREAALRHKAERKFTKAKKAIAVHKARKANAERHERSAAAELESDKLPPHAAWRRLEPPVIKVLGDALENTAPSAVRFQFIEGDTESQNFAEDFAAAFRHAGWRVGFTSAVYDGPPIYGVRVPPALVCGGDADTVWFVIKAFEGAGIKFVGGSPPEWSQRTEWSDDGVANRPFAVVYVGPKPPLHPESSAGVMAAEV